jgi:hypothetical protein
MRSSQKIQARVLFALLINLVILSMSITDIA